MCKDYFKETCWCSVPLGQDSEFPNGSRSYLNFSKCRQLKKLTCYQTKEFPEAHALYSDMLTSLMWQVFPWCQQQLVMFYSYKCTRWVKDRSFDSYLVMLQTLLFSLKHYKNHSFSWMTHSTMQLVGLHWVFWQEYGLFSTKETYGGWKQQRAITGLQVGLKHEVDRDFIYIRPCTSITDIKVFHLTQSFTKNCN